MKKNIKIAATLTLTCALALTIGTISFASGQKNNPTPASIETVANEAEYTEDYEVFEENTWLTAKDPSVDEGIRRLFDEINMSDNTEAYCPTAVLAYMVSDEGTSWKVLAEVNTIIPEASSNYIILEIFEDMEGKVRIEKNTPLCLNHTPTITVSAGPHARIRLLQITSLQDSKRQSTPLTAYI